MGNKKYHTIRLSHEAHIALVVLAAEASIRRSEQVSMMQLLSELVMAELERTRV